MGGQGSREGLWPGVRQCVGRRERGLSGGAGARRLGVRPACGQLRQLLQPLLQLQRELLVAPPAHGLHVKLHELVSGEEPAVRTALHPAALNLASSGPTEAEEWASWAPSPQPPHPACFQPGVTVVQERASRPPFPPDTSLRFQRPRALPASCRPWEAGLCLTSAQSHRTPRGFLTEPCVGASPTPLVCCSESWRALPSPEPGGCRCVGGTCHSASRCALDQPAWGWDCPLPPLYAHSLTKVGTQGGRERRPPCTSRSDPSSQDTLCR